MSEAQNTQKRVLGDCIQCNNTFLYAEHITRELFEQEGYGSIYQYEPKKLCSGERTLYDCIEIVCNSCKKRICDALALCHLLQENIHTSNGMMTHTQENETHTKEVTSNRNDALKIEPSKETGTQETISDPNRMYIEGESLLSSAIDHTVFSCYLCARVFIEEYDTLSVRPLRFAPSNRISIRGMCAECFASRVPSKETRENPHTGPVRYPSERPHIPIVYLPTGLRLVPFQRFVESKLTRTRRLPKIGNGTYGSVFEIGDHIVLKTSTNSDDNEGLDQASLRELLIMGIFAQYPPMYSVTPTCISVYATYSHIEKPTPRLKSDKRDIKRLHLSYTMPDSGWTLQEYSWDVKSSRINPSLKLLAALVELHCHYGITHRDLSQNNVLFNHRVNQITLIDFGMSRCGVPLHAYADFMPSLSHTVATLTVRSPELVLGELLNVSGDTPAQIMYGIHSKKLKDSVQHMLKTCCKREYNPYLLDVFSIAISLRHLWYCAEDTNRGSKCKCYCTAYDKESVLLQYYRIMDDLHSNAKIRDVMDTYVPYLWDILMFMLVDDPTLRATPHDIQAYLEFLEPIDTSAETLEKVSHLSKSTTSRTPMCFEDIFPNIEALPSSSYYLEPFKLVYNNHLIVPETTHDAKNAPCKCREPTEFERNRARMNAQNRLLAIAKKNQKRRCYKTRAGHQENKAKAKKDSQNLKNAGTFNPIPSDVFLHPVSSESGHESSTSIPSKIRTPFERSLERLRVYRNEPWPMLQKPCVTNDAPGVLCATEFFFNFYSWTSLAKTIFIQSAYEKMLKNGESFTTDECGSHWSFHGRTEEHLFYANFRSHQILFTWLFEVIAKFKLGRQVFAATHMLYAMFTQETTKPIVKSHIQLIGVTCLNIVARLFEIYPPEMRDFIYICDRAYTRQEFLEKELEILQTVGHKFYNIIFNPVYVLDNVILEYADHSDLTDGSVYDQCLAQGMLLVETPKLLQKDSQPNASIIYWPRRILTFVLLHVHSTILSPLHIAALTLEVCVRLVACQKCRVFYQTVLATFPKAIQQYLSSVAPMKITESIISKIDLKNDPERLYNNLCKDRTSVLPCKECFEKFKNITHH